MVASDIIKQARTRLGDTDITGWSDDTLLSFLDHGQRVICKSTGVYRRIAYLGLRNNHTYYLLPNDFYQVNRVEYMGSPLDILSREDVDVRHVPKGLHVKKSNLNIETLEISEAFTDLTNYASFITGFVLVNNDEEVDPYGVYNYTEIDGTAEESTAPINYLGVVGSVTLPGYDTTELLQYGDITGALPETAIVTFDADTLGVVTDLDLQYNDINTQYGFTDVVDNKNTVGTYGICTDALDITTHIKVFYSATSNKVSNIHDALVLDDIWSKALIHYVVGQARQDDNDEGNYTLGAAEMKLFDEEVKVAKKLSARSYNSSVREIKETKYRRV